MYALDEAAEVVDGIAKSLAGLELSFVQPGKVRAVKVKKGDEAEAGDILVALRDDIQNIQKKILIARF